MAQMTTNTGCGRPAAPFVRSISMTSNNTQVSVPIERENKRTSCGKICQFALLVVVVGMVVSLGVGFVCIYVKERREIEDLTKKMMQRPLLHDDKKCKPCGGRHQRFQENAPSTMPCCKPVAARPTASKLIAGSPAPGADQSRATPSGKPVRAQMYLEEFHPGHMSGASMATVTGWGTRSQQAIKPRPNSVLQFTSRTGMFQLNKGSSPRIVQIDVQLQFNADTTTTQAGNTEYKVAIFKGKQLGTELLLAKRTEVQRRLYTSPTPNNFKAPATAVTVSIRTLLMPGDRIFVKAQPAKLISGEKFENFFSVFEL